MEGFLLLLIWCCGLTLMYPACYNYIFRFYIFLDGNLKVNLILKLYLYLYSLKC